MRQEFLRIWQIAGFRVVARLYEFSGENRVVFAVLEVRPGAFWLAGGSGPKIPSGKEVVFK